jgi:nicotinate-nucleotide pyrophosphorylase (carboxylating)
MIKLPSSILLDRLLKDWLLEDIGRGDFTTESILSETTGTSKAIWIIKENGIVAGLPIAAKVFSLLDEDVSFISHVEEGEWCQSGREIATIEGNLEGLLTGERLALNLVMRLSGIATATSAYVDKIQDLSTKFVDTRKTTPGLRILEKYASRVGGAVNHRMGLDDGVMIKDNHIQAAGGIDRAISLMRNNIPYPLSIEVETTNIQEVQQALQNDVDIIMLDNMPIETMIQAVETIRSSKKKVKIEASGNITLETIRAVAETGVDYISSSAPITRSHWLDLSMKIL